MSERRRAELGELISQAESDLEDVRLFRPTRAAIDEAEERLRALRAELAGLRPAPRPAPTPPTRRRRARRPTPPPAPPPTPLADEFPAALFEAWLEMWLPSCLEFYAPVVSSVEGLRLLEAACALLGDWPSARATRVRLEALAPEDALPHGPLSPRLLPPTRPAPLVDVRDGVTALERRLLRALHGLGVTHDAEPKTLRAVRRWLEEDDGVSAPTDDELAEAALALGPNAVAPLVERVSSSGAADAPWRLTSLGEFMLDAMPEQNRRAEHPLPARIPYLLISGRLGHSAIPVPLPIGRVLDEARRQLVGHPGLGFRRLATTTLGHTLALEQPHGWVAVEPTVSVEAYRAERAAEVVVTALPPGVGWNQAEAHLEALRQARLLRGVRQVRLSVTPSRVRLVCDLEHGIYAEHVEDVVTRSLLGVYPVQQRGLLGQREVELTPARALEHYLRHRLDFEVRASAPQLQHFAQRLEVLEGVLLALELGPLLTDVLRKADGVPEPGLAAWALAHLPSCARHPALLEFAHVEARWREAVQAVSQRLHALEGWTSASTFTHGFSASQVKVLHSGKALGRSQAEVFEELSRTHFAALQERWNAHTLVVKQRVAADLDELGVRLAPRG